MSSHYVKLSEYTKKMSKYSANSRRNSRDCLELRLEGIIKFAFITALTPQQFTMDEALTYCGRTLYGLCRFSIY